jgi:hypothetical protein
MTPALGKVTAAKVETSRSREGKDVVEDGIHVGERDGGSGRDNEKIGREAPVELRDLRTRGRGGAGGNNTGWGTSFKPDDDARALEGKRVALCILAKLDRGAALVDRNGGRDAAFGQVLLNQNGAGNLLGIGGERQRSDCQEYSRTFVLHRTTLVWR